MNNWNVLLQNCRTGTWLFSEHFLLIFSKRNVVEIEGKKPILSETFKPALLITLYLWVFHQEQEPVSQGGAHHLRPTEKQVDYAQHQVLSVEFTQRILLFLERGNKKPPKNS